MAAPLDVVYTWVDDRFPGYLEELGRYSETPHDRNPNRTRDNLDLLRYSLRSLERFAPWVGHVYIVSCRPQVPGWIDRRADGLSLIHHDQIMPTELLPSFNSFAIVSHLDRIEGLSDRFLYIEDDMLLGAAVAPGDFFDSSGRLRLYPRLEWTPAAAGRQTEAQSPWNAALGESNHLLDQTFGTRRRRTVNHVPLAIDKLAWREMIAKWPEAFQATAKSRFRATGNVAPEFLYPYFMLNTARGRMGSLAATYRASFYLSLENNPLAGLYGRTAIGLIKPKLIAMNDNFEARPEPAVVATTRRFLERLYPEKSRFEQ